MPRGPVARRMVAACRPHADDGRFITAMAAVAGSVAEELLAAFDDPRIVRVGQRRRRHRAAPAAGRALRRRRLRRPGPRPPGAPLDGRFAVDAASPVRGIATWGWARAQLFARHRRQRHRARRGRLRSPTRRRRSSPTRSTSTMRASSACRRMRCATTATSASGSSRAVAPLPDALVATALARGAEEARAQIAAGRIVAAVLSLQGRWSVVGDLAVAPGSARIEEVSPC
jgi:hypothetical protein